MSSASAFALPPRMKPEPPPTPRQVLPDASDRPPSSSSSLTKRSLLALRREHPVTPTERQEAVVFMRGLMRECTFVGRFPEPVDTELIIVVSAVNDAYVPREDVDNTPGLPDLWPKSEHRYVSGGHIKAILFNHSAFR
ncbi:unnamed protein product [Cyprideis torosa]|uniref:Uncharacterized protein n=1 Tax=Cyprideis torosa TaxID=163714 RepID=A0A7R8WVC4_9CRUS|nr:unnamed protein product [Cyprideis torosa]CAG0910996.1 unnamed protein product [Cyprideis torosa]